MTAWRNEELEDGWTSSRRYEEAGFPHDVRAPVRRLFQSRPPGWTAMSCSGVGQFSPTGPWHGALKVECTARPPSAKGLHCVRGGQPERIRTSSGSRDAMADDRPSHDPEEFVRRQAGCSCVDSNRLGSCAALRHGACSRDAYQTVARAFRG